jgi:hypothetical protein
MHSKQLLEPAQLTMLSDSAATPPNNHLKAAAAYLSSKAGSATSLSTHASRTRCTGTYNTLHVVL